MSLTSFDDSEKIWLIDECGDFDASCHAKNQECNYLVLELPRYDYVHVALGQCEGISLAFVFAKCRGRFSCSLFASQLRRVKNYR